MPIDVTCPGCQTVYPVPEALAGKTIKCKGCGEMMEVVAAVPAAGSARSGVRERGYQPVPRSVRCTPPPGLRSIRYA